MELHQLELFSLDDPLIFPREKKKKKPVDYEKLYQLFLTQGKVKFSEIEALSGVSHCGVAQVITTLSLRYPIYEYARGIYKLYGDEEYGDGINHDAARKLLDE